MIVDPSVEEIIGSPPAEEKEKSKTKRRKRSKPNNEENILIEEAKGGLEIEPIIKEKEQQGNVEPIIEEKEQQSKVEPIIEEKEKEKGEKRKNRKSLQEALQSSTESTIKVSKWSIVNAQLEKEDKIGTDIVYSFPKNRVERANVVISRK